MFARTTQTQDVDIKRDEDEGLKTKLYIYMRGRKDVTIFLLSTVAPVSFTSTRTNRCDGEKKKKHQELGTS